MISLNMTEHISSRICIIYISFLFLYPSYFSLFSIITTDEQGKKEEEKERKLNNKTNFEYFHDPFISLYFSIS